MTADELIKAGDLSGALSVLQDVVRADPSSSKHRVFLFQLLCVLGDWKRAVAQLKISAELDEIALTMAQMYREAIICEVYREKVFSGEKEAMVFGEPEEWVALILEAQKLLASGKPEEAAELRGKAFDLAPATTGQINGEDFAWIADADMRFGPLLEIIVNGRYFWMPFSSIKEIIAEAPADLRDYVWTPVNVTLQNGSEIVGLIPTRYPGTTASDDAAAMLARKTDWQDVGGETFVGTGQRLFATDQGDVALMDLRKLTIDQGD